MINNDISLEDAYKRLIDIAYNMALLHQPQTPAEYDANTRRIEALVSLARELRTKAREQEAP
jgi:hypothetical protein